MPSPTPSLSRPWRAAALPRGCSAAHPRRTEMENQHRKIHGYRELSQDEIDLMNSIKIMGVELGQLVDRLKANPEADMRWVSIGATDLQTGLMALTRAVARPTFF